jgi:hypothetical protein
MFNEGAMFNEGTFMGLLRDYGAIEVRYVGDCDDF